MRYDTEKFYAESIGVLHEVVFRADMESFVIVFGISPTEVDHHVFVQMILAT
jgi:hypothetical protein